MACRTVQSSLVATGEELRLSSGDGTDVAPGMVPEAKSKGACTASLGKEAVCEAKSVESPCGLARTPAGSALASVPTVARLALCQKGIHQAKIPRWANEVTLGKFQNIPRQTLHLSVGHVSEYMRCISAELGIDTVWSCLSIPPPLDPAAVTGMGKSYEPCGTGTTTYYALVFSNYRSCSIYYGPNGAHSPALDSGRGVRRRIGDGDRLRGDGKRADDGRPPEPECLCSYADVMACCDT
ncbi:hypothetical protein HPB51_010428 [Rhipicephalus microplus]|uniref:Uncharacterized protein n=1 Tax=Rhipicephalus microplus TaxID=6941 RepID=A0A9J6E938_RHIMP|nr:hypothetical protein HPB51_010428 [Rhipicephalus microplus]